MKNTADSDAQAVMDLLRSRGYEVEAIQKSDDVKTPDLDVKDSSSHYLVEVKRRFVDSKLDEQLQAKLGTEGVVEEAIELQIRHSIAGKIFIAVEQFVAASPDEETYRILWYRMSELRWKTDARQIQITALGEANLVDIDDPHQTKPCYYFHESAFWTHRRELDAIVFDTPMGQRLLLNSYSSRSSKLLESKLASDIGAAAILNPASREKDGLAFVADCPLHRKEKAQVQAYVREKYGKPTLMEQPISTYRTFMLLNPSPGSGSLEKGAAQ